MNNYAKLARVKKLIDNGSYDDAWKVVVAEIVRSKQFLKDLIDAMKEKVDDPSRRS